MSVRKLGNSWWVDFGFQGRRFRKRSPDNSRLGALAYEHVLRKRLAHGEDIDAESDVDAHLTFGDAAEQWLATYVATNTKPSVQVAYRYALVQHLLPRFGERRLRSLTALDLERFKADMLKKGLSASTINNHLIVVSGLFRAAREYGWMKSSPRIVKLKLPPPTSDFLTVEESQRLLEANRDTRWHDMILCALHTGMRLGELLGLKWSSVNLETGVITVCNAFAVGIEGSPKSNRIRHIPLTSDLKIALCGRKRIGPYVFSSPDERASRIHMASHGLHVASKRARLRKFGWHILRHTFASHLAIAGISLKAIQELLGHSSIQVTMRYAHLLPSSLASAVEVLNHPVRQLDVKNTGRDDNLLPVLDHHSANVGDESGSPSHVG